MCVTHNENVEGERMNDEGEVGIKDYMQETRWLHACCGLAEKYSFD